MFVSIYLYQNHLQKKDGCQFIFKLIQNLTKKNSQPQVLQQNHKIRNSFIPSKHKFIIKKKISQSLMQPEKSEKQQIVPQKQSMSESIQENNTQIQEQQNIQKHEEEEITQETLEQFNKVCEQAHKVMLSYKEQSEELKKEITGMVGIYNQNAGTENAIPMDQIMNITNDYEKGMKEANKEYVSLSEELKNQEKERSVMVGEITDCFKKLERLEEKIKLKKLREAQKKKKQEQEKSKQNDKEGEVNSGASVSQHPKQ